MFERYTVKARQAIFYARYEASEFGSPCIESELLLLGLLRAHNSLIIHFLGSLASEESLRKQIERQTPVRNKIPTNVDLPVSDECKRIFANAAQEAERLGIGYVGTEHLLVGILLEENCAAAKLLKDQGVRLDVVRDAISKRYAENNESRPGDGASWP